MFRRPFVHCCIDVACVIHRRLCGSSASQDKQLLGRYTQYRNMAPKPAQDKVLRLRREGLTEVEIRARLKAENYKAGRVSQLLKLTRAEETREAQGRARFGV